MEELNQELEDLRKHVNALRKIKLDLTKDVSTLKAKIAESRKDLRTTRVLDRKITKNKRINKVNAVRVVEARKAELKAETMLESMKFLASALGEGFSTKFEKMAWTRANGIPFYSLTQEVDELVRLVKNGVPKKK